MLSNKFLPKNWLPTNEIYRGNSEGKKKKAAATPLLSHLELGCNLGLESHAFKILILPRRCLIPTLIHFLSS